MTETTRVIFEKYEVRKTGKQKAAFRDFVLNFAAEHGYEAKVEKASFGAKNIVIGDPESAKVIYTAHYDTCAVLPFPNFITPKNFGVYLLYQIIVVIAVYGAAGIFGGVLGFFAGLLSNVIDLPWLTENLPMLLFWIIWLLVMYLIIAGPANKHTANDNTSGVTVLLDIMADLPEEQRGKVAFIFFDLEEAGLIGSSSFASKHKRIAKETPLINFDCISDGRNILFAAKKEAADLAPVLEDAFPVTDTYAREVVTKKVFYPSDQSNFKYGVGVAALLKSKKGMLYMNKIHTPKDTVYDEENIEYLKNGAIKLAELI